jgi:hypothetical protein
MVMDSAGKKGKEMATKKESRMVDISMIANILNTCV